MNAWNMGYFVSLIPMSLGIARSAQAALPIPNAPMWTPVKDDVYLQEIEGRVATKEPLLAAAVLDEGPSQLPLEK